MKPIILSILTASLVLLSGACKSTENATFNSAKVYYVSNNGMNVLSLRSIDFGKTKEEAIYNAEKLAFQNLFFRGIPRSPFQNPLLGINEQEQYRKNRDYLDTFYKQRMQTFITYSYETISKAKKGQKQALVNITINMKALRKDLEANNVIEKFGI
ncbi:hypothetical protein [Spongiimicrobium salis]|uniref:hypothetical protein n=1 Tax=Spongiimicrobium salis TaxID=1667022 RepID=UPI00374CBD0A